MVLLLILVGVAFELALPGVGDARARVAKRLRSHHGEIAPSTVPTKLVDAVVAVEDKYFYSNVFVNVFYGAARAAFAALSQNGGDPGGSTIEQQLAKQLYPHGNGVGGALDEIGLGIKLSLSYTKSQIIAMYLDSVYYGNGYWGDETASKGYFGVPPDRLSWAEASLLAGLIQAPSAYDPLQHYSVAKKRQREVLDQLVSSHFLTKAKAREVFRAPLPLTINPRTL